MALAFDRIVAGGYFVGFGGLTPEQEECKRFTLANLDALLHVRQREKFMKEVRVCCCGYGTADEDEPLEDNNFSQFQFYLPFTNDLIDFHDKFDFLIKCVANGVCKVEIGFEERYTQALIEVMTFRDTTVPEAPAQVLDLRSLSTPRTIGEIPRNYEETQLLIDSYVKKRNGYAEKLRLELQALEQEQFEAEKRRGEHKSVMGWSNPNTPRQGEDHTAVTERGAVGGPSAASHDEDASVTRIRSAIQLAREEAELEAQQEAADRALIDAYVKNGGTLPPDSATVEASKTPLLNMLLKIQEEQVRQEQLAAHEVLSTPEPPPPTTE